MKLTLTLTLTLTLNVSDDDEFLNFLISQSQSHLLVDFSAARKTWSVCSRLILITLATGGLQSRIRKGVTSFSVQHTIVYYGDATNSGFRRTISVPGNSHPTMAEQAFLNPFFQLR